VTTYVKKKKKKGEKKWRAAFTNEKKNCEGVAFSGHVSGRQENDLTVLLNSKMRCCHIH
jgi:hypothetical protein